MGADDGVSCQAAQLVEQLMEEEEVDLNEELVKAFSSLKKEGDPDFQQDHENIDSAQHLLKGIDELVKRKNKEVLENGANAGRSGLGFDKPGAGSTSGTKYPSGAGVLNGKHATRLDQNADQAYADRLEELMKLCPSDAVQKRLDGEASDDDNEESWDGEEDIDATQQKLDALEKHKHQALLETMRGIENISKEYQEIQREMGDLKGMLYGAKGGARLANLSQESGGSLENLTKSLEGLKALQAMPGMEGLDLSGLDELQSIEDQLQVHDSGLRIGRDLEDDPDGDEDLEAELESTLTQRRNGFETAMPSGRPGGRLQSGEALLRQRQQQMNEANLETNPPPRSTSSGGNATKNKPAGKNATKANPGDDSSAASSEGFRAGCSTAAGRSAAADSKNIEETMAKIGKGNGGLRSLKQAAQKAEANLMERMDKKAMLDVIDAEILDLDKRKQSLQQTRAELVKRMGREASKRGCKPSSDDPVGWTEMIFGILLVCVAFYLASPELRKFIKAQLMAFFYPQLV